MTDTDATDATDETTDERSGVSRRRFLTGVGAAAAGTTALAVGAVELGGHRGSAAHGGPAAPAAVTEGPLAKVVPTRVPRLSIAYIRGSDAHHDLEAAVGDGAQAVPASALRAGAFRLSGKRTEVRTLGLTPHGAGPLDAAASALLVDVLLPLADAADTIVPFFAWTHRPGDASSSSPSRFTVPASRTQRFAIRVEARPVHAAKHHAPAASATADAAVAGSATQVLTSGIETGLAKLRPGIYLVALDHDHWDQARTLKPVTDRSWADHPSLVLHVGPA